MGLFKKDKKKKVEFGVPDKDEPQRPKLAKGEFEIDPQHPVVQIIGVLLAGAVAGLFINSLARWILWRS